MLSISAADPDCAEGRALIAALSAALAAITGDPGQASFDADDVRGERACFLIGRDARGQALACGALRPLQADVAELKRMYAAPGTHAGAAMLAALEAQARQFGYQSVWLSTRRINTRAVEFYLRHAYREIAPYGRYMARPASVCLGKVLGPDFL